jgi:hypothetical protein
MNAKLDVDIDAVLSSLLGKNTTPEIVDKICAKLKTIVLPWRKNNWGPPQWVRMTAAGREVGLVDSHLGGFGDAHLPVNHGWGYKAINETGQGACTSGIVKVAGDMSSDPVRDKEMKAQAVINAREDAKQIVDDFIRKELSHLRLLEDEDE